jgi:hypothetical protein
MVFKLVDSGVYAGNTAELMLVGKELNTDVRGFTLVFEALQVLFIVAFIDWCRKITITTTSNSNKQLLKVKRTRTHQQIQKK